MSHTLIANGFAGLTAAGVPINTDPAALGELRRSGDSACDGAALRRRMDVDGYLYLPGYLEPAAVLRAREEIVARLADEGMLDPAYRPIEAIACPGIEMAFRPDLAQNNAPLAELLYGERMMSLFERFFGEPVLHYDFTWLRATAPGKNASAHCDRVYMGRGTFDVLTAWTPLGDIPIDHGALMVLEGSHGKRSNLSEYLARDVDTYCVNGPNAERIESGAISWEWDGVLDHDAAALQRKLGGRWLSAHFGIGDVLVFTMATVHASLDNHSNRIRLSSDSRYQRASEPADERWIGESPIGHGIAGKRGKIC